MNDRSNMSSFPVRNPRTGETDYLMPEFSSEDVAVLAKQLRAGQKLWAARSLEQRMAALKRLAEQIAAGKDELVQAVATDTGRWAESVLEVDSTIGTIQRWLRDAPSLLAPRAPLSSATPGIMVEQNLRPYPLAGIISPWNFPLLLSMIDAYPALLVGCAVMIKPSEVTPRFVPVIQRAIAEVPELASVIGFATGRGATGEAVVRQADMVCFTGSVRTGKRVGALAAECFIPCHLELGGKDAAIVCADADLDRAAKSLAWTSMVNAGQSCMSLERAYVDQHVFDEFVERLVREVSALKLNYPNIRQGQIGPVISEAQVSILKEHLADAKAKGARILTGGNVIQMGGGYWCEPTILVNTTPDMKVVSEETFGPMLPVIPFDTEEQAIELANDSIYGLSGCVFSADLDRAHRIAERLDAGGISINDAMLTGLAQEAIKQSFKSSGLGGSRMGTASLSRFYRNQAILVNQASSSVWCFLVGENENGNV
ncbi:Aldehyde dehydrogenase [Denitratisoma oestradiolicum]|uniref:Aldehyde dehydrogenase n=2 Tax=Denitratisoma oestradiolicum TaxID=311182 RepID=A0A6S6YAF8_9PROT|nr:aldehyde dehydrogenase [Denitratisoma oestradiolicum]CAB1369592.1 Aldehyde dehydrogenase [Denitratisoma oestradiolicum]